jgi:hypothetical protein
VVISSGHDGFIVMAFLFRAEPVTQRGVFGGEEIGVRRD